MWIYFSLFLLRTPHLGNPTPHSWVAWMPGLVYSTSNLQDRMYKALARVILEPCCFVFRYSWLTWNDCCMLLRVSLQNLYRKEQKLLHSWNTSRLRLNLLSNVLKILSLTIRFKQQGKAAFTKSCINLFFFDGEGRSCVYCMFNPAKKNWGNLQMEFSCSLARSFLFNHSVVMHCTLL